MYPDLIDRHGKKNVIGGELVRDKYSDETIETRRGSFRDKNYACEQTLMVSREGGLSFPHPRPRWLDILVVQCWLPLMFARFFSCKAMFTLYRRAFCVDTKGYTVYCEHYPICDSPVYRSAQRRFAQSEKSRRNHRSYVWTESLSSMVFLPAEKLCVISWTLPKFSYFSILCTFFPQNMNEVTRSVFWT